jgi:hypothetical protein
MTLRAQPPSVSRLSRQYGTFNISQSKVRKLNIIDMLRPTVMLRMQSSKMVRRGSCKNRRFGGTHSVLRLLVTANVVPSTSILVTLMMEAISFPETSVITRATRRHIPEDNILRNHRRESLMSSDVTAVTSFI